MYSHGGFDRCSGCTLEFPSADRFPLHNFQKADCAASKPTPLELGRFGECEGGPFTRRDPATGNLSCLDLFVASRELLPHVSKLRIDSAREMAVARAVTCGEKYKMVYSDHFTCVLTLSDLPRAQVRREEKKVVWNLAREGGWEEYKVLTDKYSDKLEKEIEKGEYIEEKMKRFNQIHEKI